MNGIMGEDSAPESNIAPATESAPSTAPAEMPAAETPSKRPHAGRPKKSEAKNGDEEIRATFIVNQELLRKIKYISLVEDFMLKDAVNAALDLYIADWEKTNGNIRLPKTK